MTPEEMLAHAGEGEGVISIQVLRPGKEPVSVTAIIGEEALTKQIREYPHQPTDMLSGVLLSLARAMLGKPKRPLVQKPPSVARSLL